MDLVDEEDVAVVEGREDRGGVAGPFERGAVRHGEPDFELRGDDARQRRLAHPGGAAEQEMVDGLASLPGRGEHDLEVLFEARLADELGEPARPQRRLFGAFGRIRFGAEELLAHDGPYTRLTARRRKASRRSSSTGPSSGIVASASRTSSGS